jgi:hypothetical protein
MALVREHVAEKKQENRDTDGVGTEPPNKYNGCLLLLVRDAVLCYVDGRGELLYTAPVAFLNGSDAPSPAAVTLLLQGLTFAFPPPRTWMYDLQIELQNRILEHVSEGAIERARLGCLMDLGPRFSWMRTKDKHRRAGHIERHESHTHRSEATPVESQIWFGGTFSGVAYR